MDIDNYLELSVDEIEKAVRKYYRISDDYDVEFVCDQHHRGAHLVCAEIKKECANDD